MRHRCLARVLLLAFYVFSTEALDIVCISVLAANTLYLVVFYVAPCRARAMTSSDLTERNLVECMAHILIEWMMTVLIINQLNLQRPSPSSYSFLCSNPHLRDHHCLTVP